MTVEERWNHCCTVIDDKLFIFGGENKDKKILDDLWMLDLSK